MIRRQKIKRIEREKKSFNREYIPLVFAVLFLIALVVALVYAIMYKPEKTVINELYSMATEELPVDITNIACSNDLSNAISDDANNIKVRYEELSDYVLGKTYEVESDMNGDGVLGEIDDVGYAIRVTISGITDNVYVKITNDVDDELRLYKRSDTDNGVVYFDLTNNSQESNYNVKVYSNGMECGNILYREFNFKLPRWNYIFAYPFCRDHEDLECCKPFVFDKSSNQMYTEYKKELERITAEENQKKEEQKGIVDYVKEYKLYIIIVAVLLFAGIVVIIVKRRR